MRKLVRQAPFKIARYGFSSTYDSAANDQKTKNWSSRIGELATSQSSKLYISQLGALINYYNRLTVDTTKDINWSDWNSRIITPGFVDKLKQNFQAQYKQQYDLDKIFQDVFSRDSKAIDQINSEMAFHTAIWLNNYLDYVVFLNDLSTVSNPTEYNPVQYTDMHPGLEPRVDALVETHCYIPGSRDDVDLWTYMGKQFAWGKKIHTYYRHPTQDFKDGKGTKNSMGR